VIDEVAPGFGLDESELIPHNPLIRDEDTDAG